MYGWIGARLYVCVKGWLPETPTGIVWLPFKLKSSVDSWRRLDPDPFSLSAFSQIYISHFHLHFAVAVAVAVAVDIAIASMAYFPLFYVVLRVLFIICTVLIFHGTLRFRQAFLVKFASIKNICLIFNVRCCEPNLRHCELYRKFAEKVPKI